MVSFLENLTGGYKSRASVAGDRLIMTFPDAVTPVTWQLDLKNANGSAIELEADKTGAFSLVSKQGQKAKQTIAKFDSRGKAVRALMSTTDAIEKGVKQLSYAQHNAAQAGQVPPAVIVKNSSVLGSVMKGVLTTLLVVIVLGILGLFGLNFVVSSLNPDREAASQVSSGTVSGQNNEAVGVPLSADDFLKGR